MLATIDKAGLTLAVTDLDHWLETRVTASIDPFTPGRFLIPAEALKAAARGDKGSSRNVIPGNLPQSVIIPETHRAALITWLRSLSGKSNSVRLTWETPGHLTLTHRNGDTVGATIQIPVTTEGHPPEIAFDPKHLADALEIGPTLRLVDKLNPGMATSPSGNFCVLMSQRFTEETAKVETASETPAPAIAA